MAAQKRAAFFNSVFLNLGIIWNKIIKPIQIKIVNKFKYNDYK